MADRGEDLEDDVVVGFKFALDTGFELIEPARELLMGDEQIALLDEGI